MSISSSEFGQQVARALGSGANVARLAKQETAIADFALAQRRVWVAPQAMRWWAASAAAIALLGVIVLQVVSMERNATEPVVATKQPTLSEGIDAPSRRLIDLVDGSRLAVGEGAEIRILDQSAAKVMIVSGRVNVKVAKHQDRDWVLLAGPYRIAVLGTQFDVSFDAGSEGFEVRVTEGLVRVFGRDLPKEGLFLREGQVYASDSSTPPELGSSEGTSIEEPAGLETGAQPATAVPSAQQALVDVPPLVKTPDAKHAMPAWQRACAAGQYKDAFASGALDDFEGLLGSSSQAELLQLANCLRYGGRSLEAEGALLMLRERFPGTTSAVLSSYHLARLSLRKAKKDDAIRWFETYLAESPKGELAASARAEVVNLWVQRGNMARARAAAADYLRLHPLGSFAEQAKELLDRATSPK